MMCSKKALIGKILLFIGVLIIILIVIAGVTAWQIYDVVRTIQDEKLVIDKNSLELQKGNCSKIDEIGVSINKIIVKIETACKNPLIEYGSNKMQTLTINCNNITLLYNDLNESLELNRKNCNLKNSIETR